MKKADRELIERLRNLARSLGVKCVFSSRYKMLGCYDDESRTMYVATRFGIQETASTFFHELGHWYCNRHGIYKKYHKSASKKVVKRWGWVAERWVDQWAKKQFDLYFLNQNFGNYLYYTRERDKKNVKVFLSQWAKTRKYNE